MVRRILIATAAAVLGTSVPGAAAQAQQQPPLSAPVKSMIGSWDFSNAERDKTCSAKFSADRVGASYKVTFDANCVKLFPIVRQIVGWKFPQEDLLYLVDPQGRAIVEFSEVEDGIFEAPTPGLGVLFLQNPAAVAASSKSSSSDDIAGNWAVVGNEGKPLCVLSLAKDGFAVAPQSGCDPQIADLKLTQWRMDQGDLLLIPASGEPLRFEDADGNWRQLTQSANAFMLVRQ
jgi:hypothetical protein